MKRARALLALAGLFLTACPLLATDTPAPPTSTAVPASPSQVFQIETWPIAATPLDALVQSALQKRGITPAKACSDQVFLRRVYLDLTGTLPTPEEWLAFSYENKAPDKRAALIDALMARREFADYQTLKWCDVLRVKSEFPINLWPNAVQAYHRWLYQSVRDNLPYDQFARALLTSSGSNFRVPPTNFYRAIQGREPSAIAEAVALTFMGTRLSGWPAEKRKAMAAFFSRVAYKPTGEWKEEIVCLDPAANAPLKAVLPDGTAVQIAVGEDPRAVFADWLLKPENPWFARAVVNRIWANLMGRGIIHEPDDIRPDNPPVNPELLAYLEKELVKAKYDLRHIYRLILNSRTYQQSSIAPSKHADAETLFAFYPVRRLDAEVLIDALCWLSGTTESYSSPIPEPFTFIPETQRTIALADGSITSAFLETFGRPTRDTGLFSERNNQVTDAQRLYLLNSADMQRRISRSPRLQGCIGWAKGDVKKLIAALYVNILSREPAPSETAVAEAYFKANNLKPYEQVADLGWALVNSKEFLCRH